MYDLAIIGGGPAGVAAGVYAARKKLNTILFTQEFGGQSTVSVDVQNWIGFTHIAGTDLALSLEAHLREYADGVVDIKKGSVVVSVSANESGSFDISTDNNNYTARTILVASGSSRKRLNIPGADTFEHKGVTYCASCDGPMFTGQDVAVIGGGNAGFETAAQLLAYCKSVTLIHRGHDFTKADTLSVEAVRKHPNARLLTNTEPTKVAGDKFVSGISVINNSSKEEILLPVSGVFVETGSTPNTSYLGSLVSKDSSGHIITDPRTQRASFEGVWAAGDCTDGLYHQNNIAAGDAVKALENIYQYIVTTK